MSVDMRHAVDSYLVLTLNRRAVRFIHIPTRGPFRGCEVLAANINPTETRIAGVCEGHTCVRNMISAFGFARAGTID